MEDCIFCKIARKEIPSSIVYEDDLVLAFEDLEPQAPCHILIIPKLHIASANDIDTSNSSYVARIFEVVQKIASDQGFDKKGFRVVNNCGEDGQQTVQHLHFHLLANRKFSWPPG